MFDLGFPELMVIAIVAVLVVGPRELPRVLRTITGGMKKIRGLASEFQSSMEEMAREADLEDIRKDMKSVQSGDWKRELEDDIDPTGELQKSMKDFESDVKDSYKNPKNQAPANSIKPPSDSKSDDTSDDESGETAGQKDGEDAPRLNADGREVAEGSTVVPKVKDGGNAAPTYGKTAAKKAGAKKTAAKTGAKKSGTKKAGAKKAGTKAAAKSSPAKTATPKKADPDSGTPDSGTKA